jgi:DNA-binding CsgD family transcriptional regulator
MALAWQGEIARAREVLAATKRSDPAYRESGHLDIETIVEVWAGDFPAAAAAARECALAAPGARLRRLIGMVFGALAAFEIGDDAEMQRHLDRANGMLGGREWQWYLPVVRHVEALLAWSAQRPEQAVQQLGSALNRMLGMDAVFIAAPAQLDLAELGCVTGRAEVAADAGTQLAAMAARVPGASLHAMAGAGQAWASLAIGDTAAALAFARGSVEAAEGTECRGLQARARDVLGHALASSAPAEAAAVWEDAAARHAECGAVFRRGRVLDALRRHGSSGRRALAAAMGPDSLTRREREVAELAARGLSAKEIGAALFVGERTVETHLGNVYAKLGVESKLDLVRRAAELGLS